MPDTMFDRLSIDPGHRTLGELLQERQWALGEISRLHKKVARLSARCDEAAPRTRADQDALPPDPIDPLAGRRLLRLADVKKLVGFCGSTIYRLMGEGQFPERVHYGPRAVRWREADIVEWQNRAGKSTRTQRR